MILKRIKRYLDNSVDRELFVAANLLKINPGQKILDAGCGDQKYRKYCSNLNYFAQDFGKYSSDEKLMIGSAGIGGNDGYKYGPLDFIGNIWEIDSPDGEFDVILCTEVLEHIAYPNETIEEFSRLLRQGGRLILTAPSNCLRHMDPYFYSSGFSDRWFDEILTKNGLKILTIEPVGDYFRWMAVEIFRSIRFAKLSAFFLTPALIYFSLRRKTQLSVDTLCMGYHVVAIKQ